MQLNKFLSYFGFPDILYKTTSKFNGEIKVISVFGQNSISVGNLTQSGSIVAGLWSFATGQIRNIKNCLVLGVGGGSVIKVLRKKYPDSEITGIEIDEKMIDIGKKYFDLDRYNAKIIIEDAFKFVQKKSRRYSRDPDFRRRVGTSGQQKYDLICIDLLVGRNTPAKLSSEGFFKNIKKTLNKGGIVIINQLRLKNQEGNQKLINTLNKIFTSVEIKKPLVNTLIFCSII